MLLFDLIYAQLSVGYLLCLLLWLGRLQITALTVAIYDDTKVARSCVVRSGGEWRCCSSASSDSQWHYRTWYFFRDFV